MSEKHEDRMASVPLMNLHERRSGSGSSPVNELDWSDPEPEEFSRDPLESVLMQMRLWPQSITRQQCVRASVFSSAISLCVGFAAAFVLLIVLYPPSTCVRFLKEDSTIFSKLLQMIDADIMEVQLRNLTRSPHLAGSPEDILLAENIAQQWKDYGLEDVKSVPYNVQLPRVSEENPNKVMIIATTHEQKEAVIFQANLTYAVNNSINIPGFHAYSASGNATGLLLFVNYGTPEDYQWLTSRGINVSNKILLIRHGKIPTYTKVHLAELSKAAGVILYPDKKDFAPHGTKMVFPHTAWLPGAAVHSGSLQYSYFPETGFNPTEKDSCSPHIPVQSISYNDAEIFLSNMTGNIIAPPYWNMTYPIGPGLTNGIVKLVVGVEKVNTTVVNVFGKIEGRIEPDRLVIVGSHRDSWGLGGIDPGSGLVVQLQLSKVFGKLLNSGWRPQRTILFCNWGASTYGSSGVVNWLKDYFKVVSDRAIVYLNVDMAVQGSFALRAVTVPSLNKLLFQVTEKIPNPDPEEINAGRISVFETWLNKLPVNSSDGVEDQYPKILTPGYNSDYNHFMYTLGVPIIDLSYSFDAKGEVETYPLHNTASDSYHLTKLIDPKFQYHLAMAQLWGELIRTFADSVLLPFTMEDYGHSLNSSCFDLHQSYDQFANFSDLQFAIQNYLTAAKAFDVEVKNVDMRNPYSVRSANDRMILAERAFINPHGLSCQPHLKHIVWSPDIFTSYSGEQFMCLRFYLNQLRSSVASDQERYMKKITEEMEVLTLSINSAAFVLMPKV